MTHDQIAAYLAAFIDGEGHISCDMNGRGRISKAIAFTNTDKQLFDRVIALTGEIGLSWRVYHRTHKDRPKWSDTWIAYLSGGRPSFEAFQRLVPIQCERKQRNLADMINSYRDSEELEAIYAARRNSIECSCKQCGKQFFAFPADLNRGHGIYCSAKCSAAGRTRQFPLVCRTCGITFYVNAARHRKAHFCSMRCVGLSKVERLRAQAQKASDTRWHPERLTEGD